MPAPRVSVLLPVRDGGARLEACLDSLAAQTLADHEPRLRVLRTPPRGLVPALQLALGEARAGLLARMDADDVAHPERLARQVGRLEADEQLDVLGCRVKATADAGRRAGEGMRAYVAWTNGLLDHESMERERFVESPLVHPSVVLRAGPLRRLGGWRALDGPKDYDLWLRAFDAGLRFAKLPQVLLHWRDSPERLTRTDERYAPERFLQAKLSALLRGPLAQRTAVVWGAGPIGKAWARALVAAGRPPRAFVEVDPGKIGARIHGVPVVSLAEAAGLGGSLHLGAVGQKGARQRLRAEAARLGLCDGKDFFAVA